MTASGREMKRFSKIISVLFIFSIDQTHQYHPPENPFYSSEPLEDTTIPPLSNSIYQIPHQHHNSDEIHPQLIKCHFDSKIIHFEPEVTCQVRENLIDSQNFFIQPPPENMKIVKFLMIDNKKVEFIPLDIGKNFYNMSVMVASGNGLKSLSKKELTRLYRLKTLNLESNEIENVKFNAFDDLISLEVLDLDNNRIQQLDGKTLSSNLYLKVFSARNNKIESLHEDIFEHSLMLEIVKLQGNKIVRLSHKLLDHVPYLKKLLLENNSCIDKNYDGGKIVSTFAVDVAKMCGDKSEIISTTLVENFNREDCKFFYTTIFLSILIISTICGGISYKIYKSKRWQVRTTTMDAFENPHYTRDPEKSQGITSLGQRYQVESQKSQVESQKSQVESQKCQVEERKIDKNQNQNPQNKFSDNFDSYHEFHNQQVNDEARYVNFEALKNADSEKERSECHLYEEVKEDQQKAENCVENPNYGS